MKKVELRKLEKHKKISEEFDYIQKELEQKKIYIPQMIHPWKLDSFKEQLEKAHTEHVYA